MDTLNLIVHWFSGGEHQYMRLYQCMQRDWLWISITIAFDFAVACGYGMIALHWSRNSRNLPDIPAKRALLNMRNIFAFCGICGYAFIPIKMIWPAWRLYDCFMAFLVYFTWQYAWSARDLKVIYSELGRSTKLQEDLDRTREESQRKSSFLNAISHDLRTPLNGLLLQTEVAEMSIDHQDKELLRQTLAEIRASTRATSQLLDSLLEYARLDLGGSDPLNPQPFTLASILNEVGMRTRALAEQKQLSLRWPELNGMMVRTDRVKLERILTNLIDNAIKFTPNGSIRIEVERCGEHLEIHVIDSGIGIDPAIQPRVFEEFFQAHNHERDRTKGFGMGLAIAKRLARQLGGDITLDSSIGRGSRFSICLPGSAASNSSSQPSPPVESMQILLVEDDLTSANALKFLLKNRGYHVTIATTLAESFQLIDQAFHAVILDLMLPDGDGAALLAHIRKLNLPIRVVVTTAVSDSARIDRLKSFNPHRILRKPIDFPEILRGLLES